MSSERSSRNCVVTAGNTPLQFGLKLRLPGSSTLSGKPQACGLARVSSTSPGRALATICRNAGHGAVLKFAPQRIAWSVSCRIRFSNAIARRSTARSRRLRSAATGARTPNRRVRKSMARAPRKPGKAAFDALKDKPFPLEQPGTVGHRRRRGLAVRDAARHHLSEGRSRHAVRRDRRRRRRRGARRGRRRGLACASKRSRGSTSRASCSPTPSCTRPGRRS